MTGPLVCNSTASIVSATLTTASITNLSSMNASIVNISCNTMSVKGTSFDPNSYLPLTGGTMTGPLICYSTASMVSATLTTASITNVSCTGANIINLSCVNVSIGGTFFDPTDYVKKNTTPALTGITMGTSTMSPTVFGYLTGVTSDVQSQLNNRAVLNTAVTFSEVTINKPLVAPTSYTTTSFNSTNIGYSVSNTVVSAVQLPNASLKTVARLTLPAGTWIICGFAVFNAVSGLNTTFSSIQVGINTTEFVLPIANSTRTGTYGNSISTGNSAITESYQTIEFITTSTTYYMICSAVYSNTTLQCSSNSYIQATRIA